LIAGLAERSGASVTDYRPILGLPPKGGGRRSPTAGWGLGAHKRLL
jgi:hypothetical protein